jgi:hypothetical protein
MKNLDYLHKENTLVERIELVETKPAEQPLRKRSSLWGNPKR